MTNDLFMRAEIARLGSRVTELMAGRRVLATDRMIEAIVERRRKIAFGNTADKRDWSDCVKFDEERVRAEAIADLAVALPIIGLSK